MRIGIVCYASVGGSGIIATELGKTLAARGHDVHILSSDTPFRLGGYQPGLTFHRVETPAYPLFREPQYLLSLANKIVQVARHEQLDVVHAHYAVPHATAAYLARQILAAGADHGPVPAIITTLHGTDITLLGSDRSYSETVAFCIEQSDGVTAVSESLKADTCRELAVGRDIRVIPNFLNCEAHRRVEASSVRERLIGGDSASVAVHVSNFRPVKRVAAVIEIFDRIRRNVPAHLLLVGDGPEFDLASRLANRLGLDDRVHFLGEQDQILPLLSIADVFLLPSAQESFGLAALEAMACEVPVVASNVGGLPEVIEHGRSGFLHPPGDLDAMAASATALLADSRLHMQVTAAALDRVRTKFCEEKIVPLYEGFYEEILARGAPKQDGPDPPAFPAAPALPARPALPAPPACNIAAMKRYLLLVVLAAGALTVAPGAQMRVAPVDYEQGHVALGLALRHLANTGIYMMATAHPDDENNGLLVLLNRGLGYRTALATATRGNGGQNEIGPELFEPLGVLRTEELAAMHRFDGAEQYFTRAVDFGYSISVDETLRLWGRDEIIGDYVRLIRTVRPDVMSAQNPAATGPGQHAHHALAAMLSYEAYKVAGDARAYPGQIEEGLRPWQPRKFYVAVGGPGGGGNVPAGTRACRIDLAVFDSLLGRTYSEIGTEARSMHKCQGQAQLLALPGPSAATFTLAASTIPGQMDVEEKALFDGVDTSLAGLARFAGTKPPAALVQGLDTIAASVRSAQQSFDNEGDASTLEPLLTGLRGIRALRRELSAMALDDTGRAELDYRLGQKEDEFQDAVRAANGIRIEALADDGVVVPGQPIRVTVIIANHGAAEVNVKQVKFVGFSGDAACTLTAATAGGGAGGQGAGAKPAGPPISTLSKGQVARCTPTVGIPPGAKVTEPYWHRAGEAGRYSFDGDAPFGLPFRPTPFNLEVALAFPGGDEVVDTWPVEYRYEGDIFSGEKRMELLVTPALSVRISPEIAILPAAPAASPEIRVSVVNDSAGALESAVRLELPPGWTAAPSEQTMSFTRPDESRTVRFQVTPPRDAPVGEFQVRAVAASGSQLFDRGFQVIEYPHIRRRHIYASAVARLKVLDVRTVPDLAVGYVMGSGDEVAPFIEQLGARVQMLGSDALAWGDLSQFDTIVLGVRAYERRDDLRANNSRLLEYVRDGGTVIVQYNRSMVGDAYGPYPAEISNNRVTDEDAPVRIIEPAHPLFTTPNRLTDAAWSGWVQERGLSFLGEKDGRYRDLVELTDSFPNNPGPKRGALVEAEYGEGRWIYLALGLWRELPAGVDGAYPILANLISLGKAPPAR